MQQRSSTYSHTTLAQRQRPQAQEGMQEGQQIVEALWYYAEIYVTMSNFSFDWIP
jgi:hypothetical protein